MANTYTSLHYHLIFSTKNRERWISQDIEQPISEYLGGIARQNEMKALQIGGIEDHVHIVVGMPATLAVSKALQLLKGGSCSWIHDTFPNLAQFGWQDGYGAFTVSRSQLPELIHHVAHQRKHHRTRTFQEEYKSSWKSTALSTMSATSGDDGSSVANATPIRACVPNLGVETPSYHQPTATRSVSRSG